MKMIPLAKQSKKAQREFYKSRRKNWGDMSPVIRKTKGSHDYKSRKEELKGEY